MNIREIFFKTKDKVHKIFWADQKGTVSTDRYFRKYKSYRHYLHQIKQNQKNKKYKKAEQTVVRYLAARPNPGAGIGHQMANWMAGYWYAGFFHLSFAHIPFSNSHIPGSSNKWENFLGFGRQETKFETLKQRGYKVVRLPEFDEKSELEIGKIRGVIQSYKDNEKVVFLLEQDQFLKDLFLIQKDIKDKFYNNPERNVNKLIFDMDCYNIAIHIRRGDIVQNTKAAENQNLTMRWLDNGYYSNVLKQVLQKIATNKTIAVYIFSQGSISDFKEFEKIEQIHFCLNMKETDTFYHMVMADLLITSKSSFSYKPALLSKGIKVCPANFWHGYPEKPDWWMADDYGNLLIK